MLLPLPERQESASVKSGSALLLPFEKRTELPLNIEISLTGGKKERERGSGVTVFDSTLCKSGYFDVESFSLSYAHDAS